MKEGWELKKLDDIFNVKSSKRVHKSDWRKKGVPFYRAREVVKLSRDGFVDNDLYISENLYNEYALKTGVPKKGDIIISAVGTLGQCYLVDENDKFYFKDASVLWFQRKKEIISKYIEYAFKSNLVLKQVLHKSMGATVGTLTITRARKIKIPIPPTEEQHQIVQILDQAFEKIDQAIANIEQNIQNAEDLFQSKLNQIFSQQSEGWEEKKLEEIGKIQTGTTPPTRDRSNYGNYISFVKPAHFKNDGSINSKESQLSEKGLTKGRLIDSNSVLMVCIGATIGKTGYVDKPVSCNQQINSLTPNKYFFAKLFYFALVSPFVQSQVMSIGKASQATLPIINKTKWSNLKVRFPEDIVIQKNIVNNLSLLREKTNHIISVYNGKLQNLQDLKKSLLEKAFSGELTKDTLK